MSRTRCTQLARTSVATLLLLGGVVLGLALEVWPAQAAPQLIPRTMSYQGKLTDTVGNPVPDNTYYVEFRLYTAATGGSPVWSEVLAVQVAGGLFDTILGTSTPLDPANFVSQRWLAMSVESQPEMTPRIQLTAAPYALQAATVEADAIDESMIAAGNVVKSVNGLHDAVNLVGGTNVTVTKSGQNLTIAAAGGGGGGGSDDGDWTISGANLYHDGTGSVAIGTSAVQPWSSTQTMLQVGATLFPSIALERTGGNFQRWMIMQDTFSDALWIGPAASATSPPSAALVIKSTGHVGVGMSPIATFSIPGGNGDLSSTTGDFTIGGGSNYFKMGLTNLGGDSGRLSMRAVGTGAPAIALGAGAQDGLVLDEDELIYYGDAADRLIQFSGDAAGTPGGIINLYGHLPTLTNRISLNAQSGNNAVMYMRQADNQIGIKLDSGASLDGGAITLYNGAGASTIQIDANYSGGSGRIRTPTLEITGGSDLSEQFKINARPPIEDIDAPLASGSSTPEPGMVVAIDPDHPGELMLSAVGYDRRVAGVISGAGGVRPGMLMGQHGSIANGDHPVALTGRVYVWVDASDQAVEPGDLLTTSSVAGHAMKVTDHDRAVGAILGKAMTRLESGRGLVLALVSLQ